MPISEKRSATDGAMVVFKKPRTEVVSYADNQETTVSCLNIFYGCGTHVINCRINTVLIATISFKI